MQEVLNVIVFFIVVVTAMGEVSPTVPVFYLALFKFGILFTGAGYFFGDKWVAYFRGRKYRM